MSLFKRGNVWWAYVSQNHVRHHKSTGTTNRKKAEAIERQFREELNDAKHRLSKAKPEMTFGELSALFLAEGMGRPYSIDRLDRLLPFFSNVCLQNIDPSTVRRYRQYRHQQKQLTVATVNRDLSVLRRILYWGVEDGYLTANPLGRLRLERERRTKRAVLSVREEQCLLAAAAPHLGPIILCALDTGMRRGEICAQRWEDVDFDNQLLYVSHSKTPEGEMREIPFTKRLYDLLLSTRKKSGFVFTFKDGPLKDIKRGWAAALRRSKLRHFRFHDLRHTANTRLMLAGVMQEVRRELIGHSSRHSRDVNDRYTQIELPEKRDAIRKLDLWLSAEASKLAQTIVAPAERQEPNPE